MAETKQTSAQKKIINSTKAGIDAIVTLCDTLTDVEMNGIDFNFGTLSISPFDFLVKIGMSLGLSDKFKDWIAKLLINEIPVLEYALKGVILSKISNLISCATDPVIPSKFRLKIPLDSNSEENNGKGFFINIDTIDYNGLFKISPLTEDGTKYYFGVKDKMDSKKCKTLNELSRADDMNAFLWYTMHCPYHTTVNEIPVNMTMEDYFSSQTAPSPTPSKISPTNANSLDIYDVVGKTDGGILTGRVFRKYGSNTISMCIKNEIQETLKSIDECGNKTKEYSFSSTIAPISNSISATNWYSNEKYVNELILEQYSNKNKIITRNNKLDKPVLSFNYFNGDISTLLNSTMFSDKTSYLTLQNKMRITVLPKPAEIYPFVMALFNSKGEKDPKGHYSCLLANDEILITQPIGGIKHFKLCDKYENEEWSITDKDGNVTKYSAYLCVHNKNYWLSTSKESKSYLDKPLIIDEILVKILYECYPNVTVLNLFYDIINGVKFLDAKVIITNILGSIGNVSASGNLTINPISSVWNEEIKTVVRNLINSNDTSNFTDCSFNFSNEEFEKMIAEADDKRKKHYSFNDGTNENSIKINLESASEILNEYDETATKDEKIDILTRTIEAATGSSVNYTETTKKTEIEASLLKTLVLNMANELVLQMISPKMALIYEMAKQIMGDNKESPNMSFFMKMVMQFITPVIKEIIDFLIEQLYKFVMSQLNEEIMCATLKLAKEQAQYYIDTINDLINSCLIKIDLGKSGGDNYDTTLDKVTWADINQTPLIKEEC